MYFWENFPEMIVKRLLEDKIKLKIGTGKAILIFGARQLGKTTLLRQIFANDPATLWLNGDEPDVQAMFHEVNSAQLRQLFSGKKQIVIDEAQRIPDIGLKLKLVTDNISETQVVATGSSAFELANKTNEPLTGRKWEYRIFPLSYEEMVLHHGFLEEKRMLHTRLVYGYYPEIVANPGKEKELLKTLTDSFLYKDILLWENIQKPEKLIRLMQALAFHVGNMVSFNELSKLVGLDNKTVERYINLLEQVFIIFRLGSFSRNLRSELNSSRKIYFYDNGIRNALVASFQPVHLRQDIGALWENWLVSERMKYLHYHDVWSNAFFWRTAQQQEIDYVEDMDGSLRAWEFKWNPNSKVNFSKTFVEKYQPVSCEIVTPENFGGFIGL